MNQAHAASPALLDTQIRCRLIERAELQASNTPLGAAADVRGDNAEVSRRLLERAGGYVVYGSDGRRLGTLIELVTDGGDPAGSIAIRCERVFLWRRRTVPIAAVARVDPEEGAVMLLLDAEGVERAHERRPQAIEEGWVARRIASYAGPVVAEAEAQAINADTPAEPVQPDRREALASAASADGSPSACADVAGQAASGSHVLFVPTTAGYVLIERDGAPPRCTDKIELSDPAGSFVVLKLAQSPFPNDARLCAYLDRFD